MLDFNRDWVHVRISGLSRGWIWRNSLEMPDGIPNTRCSGEYSAGRRSRGAISCDAGRRQRLSREIGLRSAERRVQIVSVEKINETGKDTGSQLRLEFAKSVLDQ